MGYKYTNDNINNNNPYFKWGFNKHYGGMRIIGGGVGDDLYIPEPPFRELYEGPLMRPNKEIGKLLYDGAHVVHTLVRVFDGEKDEFIESVYYENKKNKNDPLIGHNVVHKFDAKKLDDKYYHPVEGSKDSLKHLTVDQLYNMIEKDQGKYEQFKNDCVLQEKF